MLAMLDGLLLFVVVAFAGAYYFREPLIARLDETLISVGYQRVVEATLTAKSVESSSPASELDKLKSRKGLQLYARRIERMALTDSERDACAYCINKANDFKEEGYRWRSRGDIVYCLQVIASALVPVLIGVLGSFGEGADQLFRILAIILSITGTICNAIDEVYKYRERGGTRAEYADQMSTLFQEFASLTGDRFGEFSPEAVPIPRRVDCDYKNLFGDKCEVHEIREKRFGAFKIYSAEYNRLLKEARAAAFLGKPHSLKQVQYGSEATSITAAADNEASTPKGRACRADSPTPATPHEVQVGMLPTSQPLQLQQQPVELLEEGSRAWTSREHESREGQALFQKI